MPAAAGNRANKGRVKRLRTVFRTVLTSRALTPAVLGIFLLLYVGTALASEEALAALIASIRENVMLAALLALIPLNVLGRMVAETARFSARRRAMAGSAESLEPKLFDETVELGSLPPLEPLQARLSAAGYRTRCGETSLSAWRGASLFPCRLLTLAATFCLSAGVLVSLTTRESHREAFIEGESFQLPSGGGTLVERIIMGETPGLLLAKTLEIKVATQQGEKRSFGLYPPSLYHGYFVYPRYLGIVPLIRFSAPDLPAGFESFVLLMIYPPGIEDNAEIPGTPYRIVFSMPEPVRGEDTLVTGRLVLQFKLFKGKDLIFSGRAPIGGEFVRDGYHLAFPEFKRLVATDLVRDYGVIMIWAAGLIFLCAFLYWLPVWLWFPRREMLFLYKEGTLHACSSAEGGSRGHAASFHETLDHLAKPVDDHLLSLSPCRGAAGRGNGRDKNQRLTRK